jgi:DNA-binding NarL/FixJ family response regulator
MIDSQTRLPTDVGQSLSRRQREVMAMSAEGLEVNEIAEVLGLSAATVKTHRGAALKRLHARNTTHAVAILLRRGDIL